ncbi:MAG: DUF3373 domain-containing protein [Desulfobulbaceae bacterium]|nr:DUF3373 domain-containing protein [Desulfobulbaceae bacterium]
MLKKISMLALAGLLTLPAAASAGMAGAAATPDELEAKVDALTRQLMELKVQMESMKEEQVVIKEDQEDFLDDYEEKSEEWDLASRFKLNGDFRARMDYYSGDLVTAPMTNAGAVMGGAAPEFGDDEMKNDTLFTNRFRLNMRVKATENVEFKARLAMYKAWGTNTQPPGLTTFGYPSFDGTSSREPNDSTLRVDRAFVNWNNIGGQPIWFSIGRRPTTDGPAAQVRLGYDIDERLATPTAYMDWPFDGIAVGYAYSDLFGMDNWPGRVRICYGRGFENSLQYNDEASSLNDTDFAGISWDVYKKGNRLAYIQSFMVFNAFSFPEFDDGNLNDQFGGFMMPMYGTADRQNVGDLVHSSAVYQDKWENLNFFVSGGWSRTLPDDDTGMFNDWLGAVGAMQGGPAYSPNTDDEDGYNIWVGTRYDMDELGLKLGLEYNYGSKYWVGMTPGHDDMYSAKLGTRGDVYEAYLIWDLPTGEAISKYAKTFVRLGYQHYEYDYSGGTDWNIKPYDLDKSEGDQYGMFVPTLKRADQVYLTFEAFF